MTTEAFMLMFVVFAVLLCIEIARKRRKVAIVAAVLGLVISGASYFLPTAPAILFDQSGTDGETTMELRWDNSFCKGYYYTDNNKENAQLYCGPVSLQEPCIISAYCKLFFIPGPASHREFNPEKVSQDVRIDKETLTLLVGEQDVLSAEVYPAGDDGRPLTWSSQDKKVATVDQHGVVTAIGPGSTQVMVQDAAGDILAVCVVTVTKKEDPPVQRFVPVTAITLVEGTDMLYRGTSAVFQAHVQPVNATDPTIRWTSSDETVATVDQTGRVSGLNCGEAVITAHAGDCSVSHVLVVTSELRLSEEELYLAPGESKCLKIEQFPWPMYESIEWVSHTPSIASVNENGEVSGEKPGQCIISAIVDGKAYDCTVCVMPAQVWPETIEMEVPSSMEVGEMCYGEAWIFPDEAWQGVIWESDAPEVVSVDEDGFLRAHAFGEATIYVCAEDDESVWNCRTIRVESAQEPVPVIYPEFDEEVLVRVGEWIELNCFIEAQECYGEMEVQIEFVPEASSYNQCFFVEDESFWIDLGFYPEDFDLCSGEQYSCVMDFYFEGEWIDFFEFDIQVF